MAENLFSFHQCVKLVFTINILLGLSTFSLTETHIIKSKKRTIYVLILLTAQLSLVAYSLYVIGSDMNSTITSIGTNLILQVFSTLYVTIAWIFNIFYQNRHINFVLKLSEYDKRFKTIYGNIENYENAKTFVKCRLIYYLLFLIVFFIFLGQLLIKNFSVKLTLQSLYHILPVTLTMGVSLQFATYVTMLKSRLEFLNKDIKNVNSSALASQMYFSGKSKGRDEGRSKNIITILTQMSILHHNLCGQINCLMRIYGVVLLGMVAVSFACIVMGVYYSLSIYRGYREEMHVTQILAIFFAIEMIFICYICASTVEEVNKTGTLIHKIDADEPELRDEIQLFSLQIANEKVEFDVIGFFIVNYTLLFSIIGGATTYVIILIQLSHN